VKSEPRKKDTKQQFTVAAWVKEAGFGSSLEEDFPPYVVDIYISDLHLGIELDGPHHFKKRDQRRDEVLFRDYGLVIWRHNNDEIVGKFKSSFIDNLMTFAQGKINAET
jgi:very-short-patch-repair endonuclease|tara:strand:+ start:326 stop:652 length:327 start_codon:yes stop_codon:yes gene_type:complete